MTAFQKVVSEHEKFLAKLARQRIADAAFRHMTLFFVLVVLLVLGGIVFSLVVGAWPALSKFGFSFLTTERWNPVTDEFGAAAPIYGTLMTSLIAMLLAVPPGFGIAVFITEVCPKRLARPFRTAIELTAGIPSIVFGIWGLYKFSPFLQQEVQPLLIKLGAYTPLTAKLFAGPPYGIGVLTAGVILSVMVLPIMTSILCEVFDAVPAVLKEAAFGLGATTWEVIWKVMVPYTRIGIVGAIMLSLGRALGETMAVTFVIGNSHRIVTSLLAPGTTISAAIANEFTEAVGDLYTSSLLALGLLLFFVTFTVLAFAKLLLLRLERQGGR